MSYFLFDWAFAFLTYKVLIATNLVDVVSWIKPAQSSAQTLESQRLYRKTLCWEVCSQTDNFPWISHLQSSSLGEIIKPVQRSLGNLLLFLLEILWWELVLSSLVTPYSQPGGECSGEMAHLCLMSEQGRAEGRTEKIGNVACLWTETAHVGPGNVGREKMESEWEPLLSLSHTDWLGSISSSSPLSTPANNKHISGSTKSTLFFPPDTKWNSVSLGKCTEKNWKFTSHWQLMAGDISWRITIDFLCSHTHP